MVIELFPKLSVPGLSPGLGISCCVSGKILAGSNPGREEILLVASCYRNRDKLWPDEPLGLYADFTCDPTRPCQRSVFVAPPDLQLWTKFLGALV